MIFGVVTEAIHYILCKIGPSEKLKLIKLLYLADKYHLQQFGRLITGDTYYAMPLGPVGSAAKDILEDDLDQLFPNWDKDQVESLIKKGSKKYSFKAACLEYKYEMLSDSDKAALDYIINHFGKKTTNDLINYTHMFPEWKRYEDLFENKLTSREEIHQDELFSKIDDSFNIDDSHISISKEIYNGVFE
jgi:uncharacterized phage-associated protein